MIDRCLFRAVVTRQSTALRWMADGLLQAHAVVANRVRKHMVGKETENVRTAIQMASHSAAPAGTLVVRFHDVEHSLVGASAAFSAHTTVGEEVRGPAPVAESTSFSSGIRTTGAGATERSADSELVAAARRTLALAKQQEKQAEQMLVEVCSAVEFVRARLDDLKAKSATVATYQQPAESKPGDTDEFEHLTVDFDALEAELARHDGRVGTDGTVRSPAANIAATWMGEVGDGRRAALEAAVIAFHIAADAAICTRKADLDTLYRPCTDTPKRDSWGAPSHG